MTEAASARTILRVDTGADHHASVSRRIADELMARIVGPDDTVIRRDAHLRMPFVDAAWVAAHYAGIEPDNLAFSDELIDELLSADEIVLVSPMYNLGVPAAMKAWVDQVARAGRTFELTDRGPVGLLKLERAWVVSASGATTFGSDHDFNTRYLAAILGILGISDVRIITASMVHVRGEDAYLDALRALDAALG